MAQQHEEERATLVRPRGRPRDADIDRRILDAALRLLGEVGYARMSLDDVATLAKVTRPTIYLRYLSKFALTAEALTHAHERAPLPPMTDHLFADLVVQLRHFQDGTTHPYSMSMIGALLAEEHATPELLVRSLWH